MARAEQKKRKSNNGNGAPLGFGSEPELARCGDLQTMTLDVPRPELLHWSRHDSRIQGSANRAVRQWSIRRSIPGV